jgi:hypothetical protein
VERGTAEFYREEAVRITSMAADAATPAVRLELLDIAACFQRMAEHAAADRRLRSGPASSKSA